MEADDCSVPPSKLIVPLLPMALAEPKLKVPSLSVVPPVYVFAPLKVKVPVPDLATTPVPETMPDKAAVPVVLVNVPLRSTVSAPTEARISSVAPRATVVPAAVVPKPVT